MESQEINQAPSTSTNMEDVSFQPTTSDTTNAPTTANASVTDCCAKTAGVIVAFKNDEYKMIIEDKDSTITAHSEKIQKLKLDVERLKKFGGGSELEGVTEDGSAAAQFQALVIERDNEIKKLRSQIILKDEKFADLEDAYRDDIGGKEWGDNRLAKANKEIEDLQDLVIETEGREEALKQENADLLTRVMDNNAEWTLLQGMYDEQKEEMKELESKITAKDGEVSDLLFRLDLITSKMKNASKAHADTLVSLLGQATLPPAAQENLKPEENAFIQLQYHVQTMYDASKQREENASGNHNQLEQAKLQSDSRIVELEGEIGRINGLLVAADNAAAAAAAQAQPLVRTFEEEWKVVEEKVQRLERDKAELEIAEEKMRKLEEEKVEWKTAADKILELENEKVEVEKRHVREMEATKTEVRQQTTASLERSSKMASDKLAKATEDIKSLKEEKTAADGRIAQLEIDAKKFADITVSHDELVTLRRQVKEYQDREQALNYKEIAISKDIAAPASKETVVTPQTTAPIIAPLENEIATLKETINKQSTHIANLVMEKATIRRDHRKEISALNRAATKANVELTKSNHFLRGNMEELKQRTAEAVAAEKPLVCRTLWKKDTPVQRKSVFKEHLFTPETPAPTAAKHPGKNTSTVTSVTVKIEENCVARDEAKPTDKAKIPGSFDPDNLTSALSSTYHPCTTSSFTPPTTITIPFTNFASKVLHWLIWTVKSSPYAIFLIVLALLACTVCCWDSVFGDPCRSIELGPFWEGKIKNMSNGGYDGVEGLIEQYPRLCGAVGYAGLVLGINAWVWGKEKFENWRYRDLL